MRRIWRIKYDRGCMRKGTYHDSIRFVANKTDTQKCYSIFLVDSMLKLVYEYFSSSTKIRAFHPFHRALKPRLLTVSNTLVQTLV